MFISIKQFKITYLIILPFIPLLLRAQSNPAKIPRAKAETLYHQAKKDFQTFENKHGHFLQTKNVRMHYLTWGSPAGIPLIWSHGSLTNSYELLYVADSLVKAGYYVIAIDYYGHGLTPIPPHEVSLYHVADDIKSLMDYLKINKAVIGGWSRGGYISSAFYDVYPERVMGIILEDGGSVATNTHYDKMEASELDSTLRSMTSTKFPDVEYKTEFDAYYDLYDSSEPGNQFQLFALIKQNKQQKWVIYENVMKLFNMQTYEQWADNVLSPSHSPLFARSMSLLDPQTIYRNLDVPMLILDPVSENDFMPFTEENAALQQQHTGLVTHKIYKDTSHNIHYERPKEFVGDLVDFMKRL